MRFDLLVDTIWLAGLACICYGLYQIYSPLAWIAAGISAMTITTIAAINTAKSKRPDVSDGGS